MKHGKGSYSKREEEILLELYTGTNNREDLQYMADILGRSTISIRAKLVNLGYYKKNYNQHTAGDGLYTFIA